MAKRRALIVAGVIALAGTVAVAAAVAQGHRHGRFGMGFGLEDGMGMGMGFGMGGGRHMGRFIKSLDANGDGVITLDEVLAKRQPYFDRMDTNKDGVLDQAEIAASVKERVDYWVKRVVKRLDADGDGKITRAEIESRAKRRFSIADHNDDGVIDANDLPPGMRGMDGMGGPHGRGMRGSEGGPFTFERLVGRIDERFKQFDRNGDGVIDASEIEAIVAESVDYWTKRFLKRFDNDKDGRVTKDEFDRPARERFAEADLDGDGRITEKDLPPFMRGRGLLK